MSDENTADYEEKLEQVLADYVRSVERGEPLDPQQLLSKYPDFAEDLRSFFRNRDAIEQLAGPIQDQAPTIGWEVAETEAGRNRVRYFGDYELVEEIARGGMGVVYRARQVSLNRPVALKMILSGQLASAADVQRFHTEAEAAANLDHPNIVPIYEIGEHEDQHYFSMKLIEGTSLGDEIVELKNDSKRAAQFLAIISRAVHHAHQRGILHRDLKPGNVLIDGDGQPHVTDFGLAKRVEGGSDLTVSGAIVGTPAYMAPEQAMGQRDLSTAVDVYSLGAILYHLLVGTPPFQSDSPMGVLMQVIEKDPDRPSTVNSGLNRDLETICLKCLQKDPSQRYDSAAALADDLERWLRGEPILARPAAPIERAWRWCCRNPLVSALATTAMICLIAGTVVSTYFGFAARARARDAEEAAELAHREAQRAEDNRQIADRERSQAEKNLGEANRQRKIATQSEAEAQRQREAAETNFRHARAAVDKYLTTNTKLVESQPDIRDYRQNLATMYANLGSAERARGRRNEALDAQKKAIDLRQKLATENPAVTAYRIDLAGSFVRMAHLQDTLGMTDESQTYYQKAIAEWEELVARDPNNPQFQHDLAGGYNDMGVALEAAGDQQEAGVYYRRAIEIQEGVVRDHADEPKFLRFLSIMYASQGTLDLKAGKLMEARQALEASHEVARKLVTKTPASSSANSRLANSFIDLAKLEAAEGDWEKAHELRLDAIEIQKRLVAEHEDATEYAKDLGGSYCNLGGFLASRQPAVALSSYDMAIATLEKTLRRDPQDHSIRRYLRNSFLGKSRTLARLGSWAKSIESWDMVLEYCAESEKDGIRVERAATLARLDFRQAVSEAARHTAGDTTPGADLYNAACVYCLATTAAMADEMMSQVQREQLAAQYVHRALALLDRAAEGGYFANSANIEHMKGDSDLDPLHSEQDFKNWLNELTTRAITP